MPWHIRYRLSEVSRAIENHGSSMAGHKYNRLIPRNRSNHLPTYVQMTRWLTNTCKTRTPLATQMQAIPVVLLHGQYRCHFGLKPTIPNRIPHQQPPTSDPRFFISGRFTADHSSSPIPSRFAGSLDSFSNLHDDFISSNFGSFTIVSNMANCNFPCLAAVGKSGFV